MQDGEGKKKQPAEAGNPVRIGKRGWGESSGMKERGRVRGPRKRYTDRQTGRSGKPRGFKNPSLRLAALVPSQPSCG